MRQSGIDIIGEVPWGTHFCQFYQAGADLLDILVPYFEAGLENNEYCMWVTSQPVGVEDAVRAMRRAVPNIGRYLERGQMEIMPHNEWYLKGGFFDLQRVLTGWVDRLNEALERGFDGLRITGNTAWLEKIDWQSFIDYEQAIDKVIGRYRMIALCTYHLDRCGASEVADVVSNHEFALIKRQGTWEIIESAKQRRAEEELRKLSRAVEQSSNTIIITDVNGNIEYINPKATELTGYASEEIIGKNPRLFKSGSTPPAEYRQLWQTIMSGGEWRGEFLNQKKNGELYWESVCISPIRNAQGAITHFLAVKEDITERKRTQEALLKAHEELERRVEERTAELAAANKELRAEIAERERVEEERDRFFSLSLDMLCIAGVDGYFKRINPAFEKTLGYAPSELLAKPFVEFIHPEDRAATIAVVQNLAAGAPLEYFENRYRCKDGTYKWLAWTAAPEVTGGRIYAAARDMTEQKRAEAEIKILNEELERRVIERTAQLQAANKELEAFAYSVSHDLRAPLRHIDGFSQALIEDYEDRLDEQGKVYLRYVREASQSMAQLIDDLLKLSRVTRAEMHRERVDFNQLAEEIVKELHGTQPERLVDLVIAPGITANGDPRLLQLVLENLFGNAWKFTSKRQRTRIEFGVARRDGERVFYVSDNGTGFDMAYVGKLFGAFQRLHSTEEFPGTGIGLATVQRIIHRHGGRIWAEGTVDKGATFYFTLG
ncbi:MAG: PAS domain S-box protein [Chloroflexi bacterium]|nr:PAS domain S-box protein [Chloroflexota bacterium]